jgi:FkbM family methyltransferase
MIRKNDGEYEQVRVTTLDRFVEENGIERIDFIKADVEGAERELFTAVVK